MKKNFISFVLVGLSVQFGFALDNGKVVALEKNIQFISNVFELKDLKSVEIKIQEILKTKPSDPTSKLYHGIMYHNYSAALGSGSGGAAKKAIAIFDELMKSAPEEIKVVALPYLGSSWALSANELTNQAAKINDVNKAYSYFDDAVNRYATVSYLPLFLRSNVSIGLPDFFEKLEQCGQDLKALETFFTQFPGRTPMVIQCASMNSLGDYYKKNKKLNEAIAAWTKAVQLDPKLVAAGKYASISLETYGD